RLAGAVGPEQPEDFALAGDERDAVKHLLLSERLLQPLDSDRGFGHFFLVVVAFLVEVAGFFVLAEDAAGFLAATFLVLVATGARTGFDSGGASGMGAGSAGVSSTGLTAGTPIVFESVRLQLSQVTIIRTNPPRCRSSRRRLRVRWQKGQ